MARATVIHFVFDDRPEDYNADTVRFLLQQSFGIFLAEDKDPDSKYVELAQLVDLPVQEAKHVHAPKHEPYRLSNLHQHRSGQPVTPYHHKSRDLSHFVEHLAKHHSHEFSVHSYRKGEARHIGLPLADHLDQRQHEVVSHLLSLKRQKALAERARLQRETQARLLSQ